MIPQTLTPAAPARPRRVGGRGAAGWGFVVRRLGFYALAAWFAVTLNFLVPRLMPGDPAAAVARQIERSTGRVLTAESVANIRALFGGGDGGPVEQYLTYLGRIARLDFGLSTSRYPVPVAELVGAALPWTLLLAGSATVVAFLLGVTVGTLAGWWPGSRLDTVITPLSMFLISVPYFWIALLAVWFFGYQLHWFPSTGGYDPALTPGANLPFAASVAYYAALPVATIVFSSFAGWTLGMRNMMITTRSADYVLLATAKGLPAWRVVARYAARNAMIPSLTTFAVALGSVVGGALLTEIVFSYPGVGYLLVDAVAQRDYPLMQCVFLIITLAVLAANLLADSLHAVLDPRVREQR